jgi:hypothetical protein
MGQEETMRSQARPLLVALTLALAASGAAWAQPARTDSGARALNERTSDVLQGNDAASDSALSAPGATTYTESYARPDMGVSASPTDAIRIDAIEPARRGMSRLKPLIDNGTSMASGHTGANALGDTGGMTTGPGGSAGIVAGGGGVHTARGVTSAGPNNGRLSEDAPPLRRMQFAASNGRSAAADAEERRARAALNDEPLPPRAAPERTQPDVARHGVDKSNAKNSETHRTAGPFVDDSGRIPGANPDAGSHAGTMNNSAPGR